MKIKDLYSKLLTNVVVGKFCSYIMLDISEESWFRIGDPSHAPMLIGYIQCFSLRMLTIFYVRAQLKEKKIVKRSIIKGYNDV